MIWKEAHIRLKANREYCHNMSTSGNCVIVLNRDTIVRLGESSGNYERTIKPNGVGVLVRPFPLKQVFIISETDTSIRLIETKEEKITDQFLHQHEIPIEVNITSTVGLRSTDLNLDTNKNAGVNIANTPNVNVLDTAGLKPTDLNIDANKNAGVNIINTPDINVINTVGLKPADLNLDANKNANVNIANAHDIYGIRWTESSSTNASLDVTLDTGEFGRPHVNIFIQSNTAAGFGITGGNEWHRRFFNITSHVFDGGGGVIWRHFTISFRYIRVATNTNGNHYVQITATR